MNGLRNRVVLETDGKLMSGRDVVTAALLGAEGVRLCHSPPGDHGACVMMRVCNLDTCPMGVATQNPELRKRFRGQTGICGEFHALYRHGDAGIYGKAGL